MLTGIVLFSLFMTGAFLGNMFLFMMIGEVNRKRPDGGQVSYFGHHYFKTKRIFGEYRRLYPEGAIHVFLSLTCWKRADASHGRNESSVLII